MTPYTFEAVKLIRTNAGRLSPVALAQLLGWPAAMLDRVALRHGISLRAIVESPVVASPSALSTPSITPREPRARTGERRDWVTIQVSGDIFLAVKLAARRLCITQSRWLADALLAGMNGALQMPPEDPRPAGAGARYLSVILTHREIELLYAHSERDQISRQQFFRRVIEAALNKTNSFAETVFA